jgi:tetratricopeptide (TPR) repeat protein
MTPHSNNGVIEDNNIACVLLQSGSYEAAGRVLQRALGSLKDQQLIERKRPSSEPSSFCSSSFQSHTKTVESSAPECDCDSMDCCDEVDTSIQSVPVVAPLCPRSASQTVAPIAMYSRAFILSSDDVEWSQLSQLDYKDWATSIIFYNVALVLHIQSSPRKALRFYQLAAALLEQITPCDEFNMLLLKSAIANNIGHCYMCISNLHGAQQAINALRELFGNVSDRLADDDYSLFYLNTALYVLDDGLRMAPAA